MAMSEVAKRRRNAGFGRDRPCASNRPGDADQRRQVLLRASAEGLVQFKRIDAGEPYLALDRVSVEDRHRVRDSDHPPVQDVGMCKTHADAESERAIGGGNFLPVRRAADAGPRVGLVLSAPDDLGPSGDQEEPKREHQDRCGDRRVHILKEVVPHTCLVASLLPRPVLQARACQRHTGVRGMRHCRRTLDRSTTGGQSCLQVERCLATRWCPSPADPCPSRPHQALWTLPSPP